MFEQITGMLVGTLDFVFSPITVFNPAISLFLVSASITLLVIFLNRLVTDNKVVSEIKENMEEIREKLTEAQKSGNKEQVSKFLDKMMTLNGKYMKHAYKTMIVSLIVIAIFLPWVKHSYEGMAVANLPFKVPFVGSDISWIIWYILVSFTIGWVVRKIFGFS